MDNDEYSEIIAMLTVLCIRIQKLQEKVNGGARFAGEQSYLNELRRDAQKIIEKVQ